MMTTKKITEKDAQKKVSNFIVSALEIAINPLQYALVEELKDDKELAQNFALKVLEQVYTIVVSVEKNNGDVKESVVCKTLFELGGETRNYRVIGEFKDSGKYCNILQDVTTELADLVQSLIRRSFVSDLKSELPHQEWKTASNLANKRVDDCKKRLSERLIFEK